MPDVKKISGCTYAGEVPKVLNIPPQKQIGPQAIHCYGCGNTVHCLNPEFAICPICAINETKGEEPK